MSPQDLEILKITLQISYIYWYLINFELWHAWYNYLHKFDKLDSLDNEFYIPLCSDAIKALFQQLHNLWHMQPT